MIRRILFVTPQRADGAIGGREQLSALHQQTLRALCGDGFHFFGLQPDRPSGLGGILRALSGQIDGANAASAKSLLAAIDRHAIEAVWFDGTNLGHLAAAIAKQRPHVRTISFAHNTERDFFAAAARRAPSLRSAAVWIANGRAERMSARASDVLVTLNARDSRRMQMLYGRPADAILPLAVADLQGTGAAGTPKGKANVLFVGGGFYANREGARWFCAEVAPKLSVDTLIVGKGMDDLRAQFEAVDRVRFVGAVDSLAPFYRDTLGAVAPIFSGSGMKTKVAEAWMFGTRVVGTPEAFEGYDVPNGCRVCETADDFVAAIDQLSTVSADHGAGLRAAYEQHHSPAALESGMATILAGRP